MRRLELDALRADLAQVDSLLGAINSENDPIGYYQFANRREELEGQIKALETTVAHHASVGLFFSGKPVLGSRGILVEFAARAVESFQDLVSKRFATLEGGSLGERGPVRFRESSDLLLTDVVRGSFGLVLEETGSNESLAETPVKIALDQVVQVIDDVANPDESVFEQVFDTVDSRQLSTIQTFFRTLDDHGASVRIVEDSKETVLDSEAVHRGKLRTESVDIDERETDEFTGTLWLLPAHRRFELRRIDTGLTIYGVVSSEYSQAHLEEVRGMDDVVGKIWKAKMRVREIRRRNREPRFTYMLLGISDPDNAPPLRGMVSAV